MCAEYGFFSSFSLSDLVWGRRCLRRFSPAIPDGTPRYSTPNKPRVCLPRCEFALPSLAHCGLTSADVLDKAYKAAPQVMVQHDAPQRTLKHVWYLLYPASPCTRWPDIRRTDCTSWENRDCRSRELRRRPTVTGVFWRCIHVCPPSSNF